MASFVSSLLDTQQNRLIKIYTPADSPLKTALGGDLLLLRSFSGHEGVSRLFQFEVTMHSTDHKIDLKSMIGQSATVVVTLPDETERYINGVFSSFTQAGSAALETGLMPTTYTEYRATVVPWLWMLTKESDCRIFQDKNVPDIVDAIFSKPEYADIVDVEYRLDGNFEPREYCVQYRETDFNFVSRLMEEEGIFYFFEHTDTTHTLVLANQPTDFKPLPYHPTISFREERAPDTISEWTMGQEVRPGAYTLRDFNFQQPKLDLTSPEFGTDPRGYEIYDYPGEYTTKGRGEAIAQTRMEEEEMPTVIASGQSICRGMTSGYRFRLKDHHRDDFNQEYMLTAVYHHSDQGDNYRTQPDSSQKNFSYVNRFQCIPYPTPFRPPRITPEPVMRGSQTAIVVGKEGEEIWPDKYGRVKVWFHWDREKERDGKPILPEERSCWIRVSESWAGNGWGSMYLPRIGQEVIVDFLEGDPDQPIITGRVYNGDNMPFYQLPDYKTLSYYKSNSSLGGKGFNELRFEDKKGKEQVFMHSQKRMDVRVKGSYYDTCHGNRETVVGWESEDDSGGDYNLLVEGDHNLHVKKGVYADIDKKLNITVKDDVVCDFENNQSTMVQSTSQVNAQQITLEALQQITLVVGSSFVTIDLTGITIQGPMVKINSGGSASPTTQPDIADADDASTSDTGEPGYLDRLAKSGYKKRSKRHRKLVGLHGPQVTRDSSGNYHVGPGVTVDGSDPNFAKAALNDVAMIGTKPTGKAMLDSINKSGNTVTIKKRAPNPADPLNAGAGPANFADATPAGQPVFDGAGNPINDASGKQLVGTGKGTNSTVEYDPSQWPAPGVTKAPSDVILEHEMTHADHQTHGTYDGSPRTDGFDTNEEFNTIGPENKYRDERGVPRRTNHHDL